MHIWIPAIGIVAALILAWREFRKNRDPIGLALTSVVAAAAVVSAVDIALLHHGNDVLMQRQSSIEQQQGGLPLFMSVVNSGSFGAL